MRFLFNKIKNWFVELKLYIGMVKAFEKEIQETM